MCLYSVIEPLPKLRSLDFVSVEISGCFVLSELSQSPSFSRLPVNPGDVQTDRRPILILLSLFFFKNKNGYWINHVNKSSSLLLFVRSSRNHVMLPSHGSQRLAWLMGRSGSTKYRSSGFAYVQSLNNTKNPYRSLKKYLINILWRFHWRSFVEQLLHCR